jgi:glycosyltransferase involved in cell wall biosynthesis
MGPIRIAYDATMLGNYFDRFDNKSGIYRVIEEVLHELAKRDAIRLTAIGLCGSDLVTNSSRIEKYLCENPSTQRCEFVPSYRSRIGLSKFYRRYFDTAFSLKINSLSKYSPRGFAERVRRKVLTKLYNVDAVPNFDDSRYDVFHSTYLPLPARTVTGRTSRVLTVYDLIPVIAPQYVHPTLTRFFTDILESIDLKNDWVLCISEFTKSEFCEYTGMSPDRVAVAPLAAADHFHPIEDRDKMAETLRLYGIESVPYFLSLAAPQPRKNLVRLIESFFLLLEERPTLDVNLVLVGSKDLGWMHDEVFAATGNSKFKSRVKFTGYVPDEHLSEIYSGASAFVFPSLYEGFGLPVLEAMQCGTPVISANCTSLPEVVGNSGILVDPEDKDALCDAMSTLLDDQAARESFRLSGLDRARSFSWERCAADHTALYNKAAGN